MTKIKNFIMFLFTIIVIFVLYMNSDKIINSLKDYLNGFLYTKPTLIIKDGNKYMKNDTYNYVKDSEDFIPYNYQDLLNIYYSTLNRGWDEFTFYCPTEYTNCINDVNIISNDKVLLSNINDFINPFNSYSTIKTLYDETGEVTISVTHLYNKYEIQQLNKDIDEMISNNINDYMNDEEKIRTLHDYIINNTKYDTQRADFDDSPYDSARINGLLYDHYAICSGYADTMAVILDKLNIKNYKVSSDNHVWNAVYLNGKWLHLDLTWDDPITTSGKDILDDSYFLIDTNTLINTDKDNDDGNVIDDHAFDLNVFSELK